MQACPAQWRDVQLRFVQADVEREGDVGNVLEQVQQGREQLQVLDGPMETTRALRTWWQGKNEQEQVNWYRGQHKLEAGSKRKFDEVVVEEASGTFGWSYEKDEGNFITWTFFFNLRENADKTYGQLCKEWEVEVYRPKTTAIFRRGQWLIHRWEGVKKATEHGEMVQGLAKRRKVASDVETLESLTKSGSQLVGRWADTRPKPETKPSPYAPQIDNDHVDSQSLPSMPCLVGGQIVRDLQARQRDDVVRASLEQDDLMSCSLGSKETGGGAEDGKEPAAANASKIEVLKVMNTAKLNAAKCDEMVKEFKASSLQLLTSLDNAITHDVANKNESADKLKDLKTETKQALEETEHVICAVKGELAAIKTTVSQLDVGGADELEEKRKQMITVMKDLNCHVAVKNFRAKSAQLQASRTRSRARKPTRAKLQCNRRPLPQPTRASWTCLSTSRALAMLARARCSKANRGTRLRWSMRKLVQTHWRRCLRRPLSKGV